VQKSTALRINYLSMLTCQFINKSQSIFLSKNFLLQKVSTKFYIQQDSDLPLFQGSDPAQNRPVPHHCQEVGIADPKLHSIGCRIQD
jgi:hypothetical protein